MKKTLDSMIVAEVQFFPTSEGGRRGLTPPKEFRCIFEIDGELFDCRLLLDDVGSISPGGRATVPIQFLFPELVEPKVSVGKEFYLREGPRIGRGALNKSPGIDSKFYYDASRCPFRLCFSNRYGPPWARARLSCTAAQYHEDAWFGFHFGLL